MLASKITVDTVGNAVHVTRHPHQANKEPVLLYDFPKREMHRATRTGERYAAYHNVPLFVDGDQVEVSKTQDPKTFTGIRRPAA